MVRGVTKRTAAGGLMVGLLGSASPAAAQTAEGMNIQVPLRMDGTDVGPALQAALNLARPGSTVQLNPVGAGSFCTLSTGVTCNTSNVRIVGDAEFHLGAAAVTAWTLTGYNQKLIGPRIVGQRVAGQKGVVCSGSVCVIDVFVELCDIHGHQPTGAGFHNFWKVKGRNAVTSPLWLQDGVGPSVDGCRYDTDGVWHGGTYAGPTKGVWLQTEGAWFGDNDFIHCGLTIECSELRNIEWGLFSAQTYWDSTLHLPAGIQIINNSTTGKYIRGLLFERTWSATGQRGVHIHGTAPLGDIDGVVFAGPIVHNNLAEAFAIEAGVNITISDPQCYGNNATGPLWGFSGPGKANGVLISTPGRVEIQGGAVRAQGFRWTSQNHTNIYATATATNVLIDGVDVSGPTLSGLPIYTAPGSGVRIMNSPVLSNSVFSEGVEYMAMGGGQRALLWLQAPYGRAVLSGKSPTYDLYDTTAAVNARYSRIYGAAGAASLQAMSDAYGLQNTAWQAERGGAGFTRVRMDVRLRLTPITVAQAKALPDLQVGDRAFVTDATTRTSYGSAVVGGGTASTPIYYDGASWRLG